MNHETTAQRPEISTRLLVHALVREDGTVDAGELYTVAGVLGMSDQQVRLCVKRLVSEGGFVQDGRGRKATLRAAAEVTESLTLDAHYVRYAYRQDAGQAPWDGTWHLFAFAIPEAHRSARDTLRDSLLHLGAAPVQGGLYVTANNVGELVEHQARRLDVLDCVTFLTSRDLRVGTLTDPPALAAALWPLQRIADRHLRLTELATSYLAGLDGNASSADRLTMTVILAAEFTRAMEPDPLLPPELLPQPWPGVRSRAISAACWRRLREGGAADGAAPPLRLFELYRDVFPDVDES
ncbi:PaaX family transcriptional regulator C-terminal domain-containing protein [Streptomyces sp. NPDC006314]|uniref:PaaX family transcriptional regulator C-terminal domain-containing protein n=1 Tax=Streptomyces sp. NPDC006314 TaxID=3154475 RepID=UPI0033A5DDD0